MSLHRGIDVPEPARGHAVPGERVRQRSQHPWRLATGTLACPACDAPVAPSGRLSPADPLACGFCDRAGAVRDFLSLASPSRPALVDVLVIAWWGRA